VSQDVQGRCARRFAAVRDAFAANFEAGREVGASFAATVDGELVVDLWGGFADGARTRAWTEDTIVNVFSTTKAMTAVCAHMLVDRGLLDLDAPVARYWPEFAAAGKAAIAVRQLLSHTAGLPGVTPRLPTEALFDWTRMTAALAAEAPWWPPGSANGYHAMTYGYLVGEVARRILGATLGTFFRREVADPLGADFHIGLAASEDHRVAEMVPASREEATAAGAPLTMDPTSLQARVLSNPLLRPEYANRPDWRRAEIPAANGHGNARSVARVMSALACGGAVGGVRLMREATLRRAIEEQAYARPRPRPPFPVGARLHADEPGPAARPEPAHLRSRRVGWLARLRRPRRPGELGLRHEQDVAGDHGRRPRRRDDCGPVRIALRAVRTRDLAS
jgi:CubicO group peptidase (beta-lactamase class C family)